MTTISRVRTVLSGFPGGPGVSTMYSTNTDTLAASVSAFWYAIRALMPGSISIQVEGSGDLFTDTTGELTGTWSGTTPAAVACTGSGNYAAPAGAVVEWMTPTVLDGRRVRGKTFIVPMMATTFQSNGTLSVDDLGNLLTAGTNLVDAEAGGLCIWHRPRLAKAADGSRPAVTARDGGHAMITSAHVPDKVCILRSRRD